MSGRDATSGALAAMRKAAGAAKSAAVGAAGFARDRRFGRSPAGKARAAAARGASTFHIRLDLDDIAYRAHRRSATDPRVDDVIDTIEAEGWDLDDLEYITEAEDWERTDADGSVTRGAKEHTSAVMLFRRRAD